MRRSLAAAAADPSEDEGAPSVPRLTQLRPELLREASPARSSPAAAGDAPLERFDCEGLGGAPAAAEAERPRLGPLSEEAAKAALGRLVAVPVAVVPAGGWAFASACRPLGLLAPGLGGARRRSCCGSQGDGASSEAAVGLGRSS